LYWNETCLGVYGYTPTVTRKLSVSLCVFRAHFMRTRLSVHDPAILLDPELTYGNTPVDTSLTDSYFKRIRFNAQRLRPNEVTFCLVMSLIWICCVCLWLGKVGDPLTVLLTG
jgi:hypothetical protein